VLDFSAFSPALSAIKQLGYAVVAAMCASHTTVHCFRRALAFGTARAGRQMRSISCTYIPPRPCNLLGNNSAVIKMYPYVLSDCNATYR
jgi:hypothetical protein